MVLNDINVCKTYQSLKAREKQLYEEELYNNVESPFFLPF